MKGPRKLLHNSTLVLAILCTGLLLYNMVAMLVYKQEIFFDRGTLSAVEIVILIGFALIPFFDVVSIGWLVSRLHQGEKIIRGAVPTMVLGVFCLVLLAPDKVMIDEIGRELPLGWEVLGEWIILYGLLTIQLIYSGVIILQLFAGSRARYGDGKKVIPL